MLSFKKKSRKTGKGSIQQGADKHDITQSPFIWREDKQLKGVLKVDEVALKNGQLAVSGWQAFKHEPYLQVIVDGEAIEGVLRPQQRDDVASALNGISGGEELNVSGFLFTTSLDGNTAEPLSLEWFPAGKAPSICFHLPGQAIKYGTSAASSTRAAVQSVAKQQPMAVAIDQNGLPAFLNSVAWVANDVLIGQAHIDNAGFIPGRCGLLAGWAVTMPGWTLHVMDNHGNTVPLTTAVRYQREDIVDLFRDLYGQHTVDGGFVLNWPFALQPGDTLQVIAVDDELKSATVLAQSKPEKVSADPEGYVRWSFTVPTPAEKFNERLNRWEGQLIEDLLQERQAYFEEHRSSPEVTQLGSPGESPVVSIIIPLYNRWDFVEHQLLAFSRDKMLLETAEIIYVVDDPRILTAVSNEVENLHKLYEVPFKLVWGHRNRGFSGANNLGVSVSRGRQVLYLNSDAFPCTPGWLNRLSTLLDRHPEYGMLGTRLLNPEGGMQHAGMEFVYSTSWQVWLNKHPRAGLAPELDDMDDGQEVIEKPAVTGACVLLERELVDAIGGFDEGYLIGDFEDSDMCLKVISHGKKIGYVPSIELVHLERQSFSTLGDTSFRTLVVRFNAWRHTKRWNAQIADVMKRFA